MQLAGESQEVGNTHLCSWFGFELPNKWLSRVLFCIRKILKLLSPRQYPNKPDLPVKNAWWTARSFSLFFCACTDKSAGGIMHSTCLLFPFHGYGQENFDSKNSATWHRCTDLFQKFYPWWPQRVFLSPSHLLNLWALPCFRTMQWSWRTLERDVPLE